MMSKPKFKNGIYVFNDQPDFTPNLSPLEIFKLGSFGGGYWRPIYSSVNNKTYKGQHKKYKDIYDLPPELTTNKIYDTNVNKYKVKVGTSLKYWETKEWIHSQDPYGWIQWYCEFFKGRRSYDDERQIKRWIGIAGKKGRFRKRLENLIENSNTSNSNYTISPKIRQTLQHWAYRIDK